LRVHALSFLRESGTPTGFSPFFPFNFFPPRSALWPGGFSSPFFLLSQRPSFLEGVFFFFFHCFPFHPLNPFQLNSIAENSLPPARSVSPVSTKAKGFFPRRPFKPGTSCGRKTHRSYLTVPSFPPSHPFSAIFSCITPSFRAGCRGLHSPKPAGRFSISWSSL